MHSYRATHVQNEDGSLIMLNASNPRQRKAVAKKLLTPSKSGTHFGSTKKVLHDAVMCQRFVSFDVIGLSTS